MVVPKTTVSSGVSPPVRRIRSRRRQRSCSRKARAWRFKLDFLCLDGYVLDTVLVQRNGGSAHEKFLRRVVLRYDRLAHIVVAPVNVAPFLLDGKVQDLGGAGESGLARRLQGRALQVSRLDKYLEVILL